MKCPECEREGAKSRVWAGPSSSTCMGVQMYWDEDGAQHVHDPNATGESYSCSRGHTWSVRHWKKCPSCDFNADRH